MSNPFDQFDPPKSRTYGQRKANPFDQFDEVAPAPKDNLASAADYEPLPDLMPEYDENGRMLRKTPFDPPIRGERPGLGEVLWNAVRRGGADAVSSTAFTVADTLDQTIQKPLRLLNPILGGIYDDPLGFAAEARINKGARAAIDADRRDMAGRIGGRPTIRDVKAAPMDSAKQYGLHIANAVGESAPLMAAAVATRSPTLGSAVMGGVTGAQTYTGLLGEGVGRMDAAKAAGLTAATESVGQGFSLPAVLGARARGSLARATAAEALQEAPVQIAQQYVEDQTLGKETPVLQQLGDALDAALAGGVMGAGGHLLSTGTDALGGAGAQPDATDGIPTGEVIGGTPATAADIANDAEVVRAFRERQAAAVPPESMDDLDALLARNLPPAAPAPETPSSEGAGVAATPEVVQAVAQALGLGDIAAGDANGRPAPDGQDIPASPAVGGEPAASPALAGENQPVAGLPAAAAEAVANPAPAGAQAPAVAPDGYAPPPPSRYGPLDLRQEIGWSQRGGELVRAAPDPAELNADERAGLVPAPPGKVVGRTRWTGWQAPDGTESTFWKNRPVKFTPDQANAAFDKFERGEALSKPEQRFIDYAAAKAAEYDAAMNALDDIERGYSEVERQRGMEELRQQLDFDIAEADRSEALSVYELAHRAAEAGVDEFDIAQFTNESQPAYAARLWSMIQEAERGTDTRAAAEDRGGGNRGREGGAQGVPQGFGLQAPAAEAPAAQEVAPTSAGLFGAPKSSDFVDAARRAKDAARDGRAGTGRTDMAAGDGELFAGPRPAQMGIGPSRPVLQAKGKTAKVKPQYVVAESRAVKRGVMGGERPVIEFVPTEVFGRHDTILQAKAAYAKAMEKGLRNKSDEFAARHFDQQARNEKSVKIVKAAPTEQQQPAPPSTDSGALESVEDTGYGSPEWDASVEEALTDAGIAIPSKVVAEKLWTDGWHRIFAMHENADAAIEVTSIDMLRNYAPDQLMALPRSVADEYGIAERGGLEDVQELSDADLTPAQRASFDRQSIDRKGLREQLSRQQGDADADALGLRDAVTKALGESGNKVVYLRGVEGLPENVRGPQQRMQSQRGSNMRTAGLFHPATGTVYLFTNVVKSPQMAAFTASHEIAGHQGLRALLGNRLNAVLDLAEQNPTVKAVAASMTRQRNLRGDQRYLAIEEALADLAAANRTGNWQRITDKHGVEVPKAMRSRLVAMLQNIVARIKALFGKRGVEFTDAQVLNLLENAWQAAQADSAIGTPESALESAEGGSLAGMDLSQTKVVGKDGKPLTVFHGSTSAIAGDYRIPAFFSESREGAEWFAQDGGKVNTAKLDIRNPLDVSTQSGAFKFIQLARKAGVKVESDIADNGQPWDFLAPEIAKYSPYDGTNVADLVYIPKVRAAMVAAGYDGLKAADPLENGDHDVWVALRSEQIQPEVLESTEGQTQSEAFKRWFGDSVVTEDGKAGGKPLVVYHGAPDARFASDDGVFKNRHQQAGMSGGSSAFWFAKDRRTAATYADDRRAFDYQSAEPGIVAAYLSLQNPLVVDGGGKLWRDAQQLGKTRNVIEQARDGGHDGVIIRDVRDDYMNSTAAKGSATRSTDTYVVFDSRQIKSATSNNGNFDPNNPSILESVEYTPEQEAAMVKAGMPVDRRSTLQRAKARIMEDWQKVREAARDSDALKQAVFDRFHGLRAAEAQLGLSDPALSPYMAARMSVAQAQNVEATMLYGAPKWDGGMVAIDDNTVGLLDALKPVEGKIDAWLGWMVGRRAKLLKSQGRENNLSDADIAALLSLADGQEQAFKDAAIGYLKIKNAILDFAQEAGIIDPVARAAWDHAEYIPFYRAENEGTIGPGTRRGLAGQTAGIRTLKGGQEALADPLANIIRNFAKLIDASTKNRAVLLAVDQLGAKFFKPASREVQPATIPLDQVKKHLREQGVPEATLQGMPPGALKGVQRMLSIVPPTGENVVRVMRDGKAEYYEVLDPLVLRSLTAFKQPNRSLAVKPLIWFKRLLTTGVTTTAEFVGANFIRDSGSAWVMSDDRFKPGWDSLAGVAHTLRNDKTAKEMMMAGGTFLGGNFYDGNPDAAAAALRRALRKNGMGNRDIEGFMGTVARSPLMLWDKWMQLSGAVENANRRAVFDAAIKAGRTRAEAAFLARDLMDFNMQGDAAFIQFFSDVLPFFNARLQGLYKLGRRAGTKEGKRAILLRGGIITLASLALYAWNVMAHGDAWDELEEWDKDAYWHIAPGTEFHTRIPKPFEIGLAFATMPERALEAVRYATTGGGDKPSATWDSLTRAITGTLAFNPIPQAFLPLAEQWANKRFFTSRPIENMGDDKLLPEDRADWYTSDVAKDLGRLSGLSPKRLEHLWNGYTAGLGGYVLDSADAFARWAKDAPERPTMAPKDWPVVGRFYRGDTPGNSKYVEQFYRRFEKAEQVEQSIKAAIEAEDGARAEKLEAENKALLGDRELSKRAKAGFMFTKVKEMRKIRDAMGKLRENAETVAMSSKSPDEKRKALDEMTRQRNKLARDAIKQSGG